MQREHATQIVKRINSFLDSLHFLLGFGDGIDVSGGVIQFLGDEAFFGDLKYAYAQLDSWYLT